MRVTVLAALAVAGLLGDALAGAPENPFDALRLARMESGIRAPAFTLPDLAGREVRVTGEPGPATLLVFWTTW